MDPQAKAVAVASEFVAKLNDAFLFPVIYLLSAVALLVFVYGGAKYIMNGGNDSSREEGNRHMTYGIIGLVVMASAYAILSIAAGTFGLQKDLDCATDPNASGCDIFMAPGGGGGNTGGGGGNTGAGGGNTGGGGGNSGGGR